MSTITTGNNTPDLLPVIDTVFGTSYKEWDSKYDKVFEVSKTGERYVTDYLIRGTDVPTIKGEGADILYNDLDGGWVKRYEHVVYTTGFVISREAMDDGHAVRLAAEQAKAAKRAQLRGREIVCADVFNNGFDTSAANLGGDGKPLYSTTHPLLIGGTASNTAAVAADMSESMFETAQNDIFALVADDGGFINIMPTTVMIHPVQWADYQRICHNPNRPATSDRDISAINSMGLFQKVILNPYLSDTDAVYIMTDCENGLKYIERNGMEVTTDNHFESENAKFKSRIRYSVGWTDWRKTYCNPGA